MKNDCNEIKNLIPLYLDNALTHIDSDAVKQHLKECEDCRLEYEFLKNIINATADLPEISPSADFNDNLHKKLIEAKKAKSKKNILNFRNILAASVSAAAVIAISVVSLNLLDGKDITVMPDNSIATHEPLVASLSRAAMPVETEEANEAEPEESKTPAPPVQTTAPPVATKAPEKSKEDETKKVETKTAENTSTPKTQSVKTEDKKPAVTQAPAKETTPKVNVPSKIKVTVNVTVDYEKRALAKQMLSSFPYSNGTYSMSQSDYYSVMSKLDALGATQSMTREDKTSTYATLTGQLQTASKSEATSIQKKLDQIDAEISKTYVILN